MLALAIAFLTSLLITLLVIRYQHLHGHFTARHDMWTAFNGTQPMKEIWA
jgi:hypothetical protein